MSDIGGTMEIDLSGLIALQRGLPAAIKAAVERSARPVQSRVKAEAAAISRYGFLAASIMTKVKAYRPDNVVTIVGPNVGFTRTEGTYSRGKRKGQARKHTPAMYAWLVDQGTSRSRKFGFLERAMSATAGNYPTDFAQAMADELQKLN